MKVRAYNIIHAQTLLSQIYEQYCIGTNNLNNGHLSINQILVVVTLIMMRDGELKKEFSRMEGA